MNNKKTDLQRGQSLIIIALLLIAMLAFLGLVIDGGSAFVTRRGAQNASDAAAFAGARTMAVSDASASSEYAIWNAIYTFAQSNGVAGQNDVTPYFVDQNGANIRTINKSNFVGVPSNATGVRVFSNITFQPLFITVLGGGGPDTATAHALVQSGQPTNESSLFPMAIFTQTFDYVSTYCFGNLCTGGTGAQFGWLTWDGNGNEPDLVNTLNGLIDSSTVYSDPAHSCGLATPPCSFSTTNWNNTDPNSRVYANTGVKGSSGVKTALNQYLNKPVTIPIYDGDNGLTGSNYQLHVVGFAEFTLTGYDFNGANKSEITGTFSRYVAGAVGHPGPCNKIGLICALSLTE